MQDHHPLHRVPTNTWLCSSQRTCGRWASLFSATRHPHRCQPDALATACDNFYCRAKFSVLERRHVRVSPCPARQISPCCSIAESAAVCFATAVPRGSPISWMCPISISFIRRAMSLSQPLTVLRHLSAWKRSATSVGIRFMVHRAPLTRDRPLLC